MTLIKAFFMMILCLAMSPLFIVGLLAGIVGWWFACGWFWGQAYMEQLFEIEGGIWSFRVENKQ